MKRITWLASYPKSGNTWLRVFLTNLERGEGEPASINALDFVSGSGTRIHFDEAVGYKAADLTHDEIDRLRPDVYVYESRVRDSAFYCKVHDAFSRLPDGRALFPPEVTSGAIYLIRNPLDVCVSFAHHLSEPDLDAVIASMADPGFAFCEVTRGQVWQLRQRLSSWSGHVLSWVDASEVPVHVMRYEDMTRLPEKTFTAAAAFLGLPHGRERVVDALRKSAFEELQRQEREQGFGERPPSAPSFFREGRVGSWRETLQADQAARIIRDHRDVMRRFGYLTEGDEPVF